MGQFVAKHNSKILKESAPNQPKSKPNCNCQARFKQSCPMPGECNTNGVVYQATVTSNGETETYIGLAKYFKKRYSKHKATLLVKPTDGKTCLSTHFWNEKDLGKDLQN